MIPKILLCSGSGIVSNLGSPARSLVFLFHRLFITRGTYLARVLPPDSVNHIFDYNQQELGLLNILMANQRLLR